MIVVDDPFIVFLYLLFMQKNCISLNALRPFSTKKRTQIDNIWVHFLLIIFRWACRTCWVEVIF